MQKGELIDGKYKVTDVKLDKSINLFLGYDVQNNKVVRISYFKKKNFFYPELTKILDLISEADEEHRIPIIDKVVANNKLFIISEKYMTLEEYVKEKGKLTENECKDIFRQIFEIYKKILLPNSICHRSIQPRNITINISPVTGEMSVSLQNFCYSKLIYKNKKVKAGKRYGLNRCTPPEILTSKKGITQFSLLIDVWSLGCTLFFCLFNSKLYSKRSLNGLGKYLETLDTVKLPKNNFTVDCKNFLYGCLQIDPQNRISWEELYTHPWLYDNDSNNENKEEEEEINSEIKEYAEKIDQLEYIIVESKDNIIQLKREIKNLNNKLKAANQTNEALQNKISALTKDLNEPKKLCSNCKAPNCTKLCSGCNSIYYCSRKCQADHWRIHKSKCINNNNNNNNSN
eukprot:TRINITY_DN1624_c0_g1_i1.p1 TRINITY_DN1624_c0_g1~~TRINITY_DN1624_c0_g1_i1.p1  ORF type:complete len:401 (-),score=56.37 TRINITY_DN1624_c0_g1_i1:209-1411(-)